MKRKWQFSALFYMILLLLLCCGCRPNRSENKNHETGSVNEAVYDYEDYEMMDFAAGDSAFVNSKSVPMAANAELSEQKRMIQKSANINIQVMDPLDSAEKLIALTDQMGGFVVSSSSSQEYYSGDIYLPRVNLTIRVPAEKLNETLSFIENLTSDSNKYVSNKRIYGVDITSEYVDTNSRLVSLEKTLEKLYEILNTAENAEEALEVYNRISEIETDIEVYKGQIKYMEESVALSSIEVQISSIRPAPTQTVYRWSIGDVVSDAFESLLDNGKSVVEFIIYFIIVIIPIIIMFAIPVVIIIFVVRKIIRSKKARQVKNNSENTEKDQLTEVRKN